MQKEKTPENGEQCQQCRAESMELGLSDVDVIQRAQVVVQTELLLSLPSATMPPIHWNDSHFTDLATLRICQSCTSILVRVQYTINVFQLLVVSVTQ